MPFADIAGAKLYWKLEGEGTAPPLVLLNSIGTDMDLWDDCLPALRSHHRILRIDTRGHGASNVPAGDYSMAGLAADVLAVMDAAGLEHASVAGVSLGGMIAMEMALASPERITGVALICTSATMDSAAWSDRVTTVRDGGMMAIADVVMSRFFSPQFMVERPDRVATIRRQLLGMDLHGYAGCAAAIRDMDLAARLAFMACPALVVTGTRDTSTPLDPHGEFLLSTIPDATHVALESAHLAPFEAPEALGNALLSFHKQ